MNDGCTNTLTPRWISALELELRGRACVLGFQLSLTPSLSPAQYLVSTGQVALHNGMAVQGVRLERAGEAVLWSHLEVSINWDNLIWQVQGASEDCWVSRRYAECRQPAPRLT